MATAMTAVFAAAFQLASWEASACDECIVFPIAGRLTSVSYMVAFIALDVRGLVLRSYGIEGEAVTRFGGRVCRLDKAASENVSAVSAVLPQGCTYC